MTCTRQGAARGELRHAIGACPPTHPHLICDLIERVDSPVRDVSPGELVGDQAVLSQQPCSVSIGLFFCDTGLSLLFGGDGLLLSVGICSLLFIIFVFFALSSAAPAALIQCFQAAVCCAKCLLTARAYELPKLRLWLVKEGLPVGDVMCVALPNIIKPIADVSEWIKIEFIHVRPSALAKGSAE